MGYVVDSTGTGSGTTILGLIIEAVLNDRAAASSPGGGSLRQVWSESNAKSCGPKRQAVTLASGDNVVTVPPQAVAFIMEPPQTLTGIPAVKLKGIAGDTGDVLGLTGWSLFTLATTQTTVIFNLSGVSSLILTLTWF